MFTYRKQLLLAVEAFLKRTPSSSARAQNIIQRCKNIINSEEKEMTLDHIIWSFFIQALTDSVYYENEEFLHTTYEMLIGHDLRNVVRTVCSDDYRVYFTAKEVEWHTQLVSMMDFLMSIPLAKIHKVMMQTQQNEEDWISLFARMPEKVQIEHIEEEYMQRRTLIKNISASNPPFESVGDEKIYHLVLQEVTSLLTEINVGMTAAYMGYPILGGPYSSYTGSIAVTHEYPDITTSLLWAQRLLNALIGQGALFLSWRLRKAPMFDTDILILHLL